MESSRLPEKPHWTPSPVCTFLLLQILWFLLSCILEADTSLPCTHLVLLSLGIVFLSSKFLHHFLREQKQQQDGLSCHCASVLCSGFWVKSGMLWDQRGDGSSFIRWLNWVHFLAALCGDHNIYIQHVGLAGMTLFCLSWTSCFGLTQTCFRFFFPCKIKH